MREHITPIVLAATVGMCVSVRPVHQIVVTTFQSTRSTPPEELYLPAGFGDLEVTVQVLENLLAARKMPFLVESDVALQAKRFHALVDREFLGVLTQLECKELEALSRWHDDQKAAFYRNILPEHSWEA